MEASRTPALRGRRPAPLSVIAVLLARFGPIVVAVSALGAPSDVGLAATLAFVVALIVAARLIVWPLADSLAKRLGVAEDEEDLAADVVLALLLAWLVASMVLEDAVASAGLYRALTFGVLITVLAAVLAVRRSRSAGGARQSDGA